MHRRRATASSSLSHSDVIEPLRAPPRRISPGRFCCYIGLCFASVLVLGVFWIVFLGFQSLYIEAVHPHRSFYSQSSAGQGPSVYPLITETTALSIFTKVECSGPNGYHEILSEHTLPSLFLGDVTSFTIPLSIPVAILTNTSYELNADFEVIPNERVTVYSVNNQAVDTLSHVPSSKLSVGLLRRLGSELNTSHVSSRTGVLQKVALHGLYETNVYSLKRFRNQQQKFKKEMESCGLAYERATKPCPNQVLSSLVFRNLYEVEAETEQTKLLYSTPFISPNLRSRPKDYVEFNDTDDVLHLDLLVTYSPISLFKANLVHMLESSAAIDLAVSNASLESRQHISDVFNYMSGDHHHTSNRPWIAEFVAIGILLLGLLGQASNFYYWLSLNNIIGISSFGYFIETFGDISFQFLKSYKSLTLIGLQDFITILTVSIMVWRLCKLEINGYRISKSPTSAAEKSSRRFDMEIGYMWRIMVLAVCILAWPIISESTVSHAKWTPSYLAYTANGHELGSLYARYWQIVFNFRRKTFAGRNRLYVLIQAVLLFAFVFDMPGRIAGDSSFDMSNLRLTHLLWSFNDFVSIGQCIFYPTPGRSNRVLYDE